MRALAALDARRRFVRRLVHADGIDRWLASRQALRASPARLAFCFLRDSCAKFSTIHTFATRRSVMLGVPFAAQIRFVAAINSPISAAE